MTNDQTYLDTAHLLRRAGFGAGPKEIAAAAQRGIETTTSALLHPEKTPDTMQDDDLIARLASLVPERKNGKMPVQVVKMWWTQKMLATPNPLVEKMTLFWHGHFATKLTGDGDDMLVQNRTFREHALGNFRTLTLAISRDPAMLRYLNGNQNFKAHPNENYARELMELFTCGIGNYTEDDVKAAARAFSGWNTQAGGFGFFPQRHDNDPKTFMGKTGNWNGDDIVDILCAHPATAKRLCTQLFSYFAYTNPEPSVVNALVNTYYSSGYDIKAVVGQILRSKAFYSPKARYALIKSPAQFVIGTVKMLELEPAFLIKPSDISLTDDIAAAAPGATTTVTPAQRRKSLQVNRLAGLTLAMRSMGQDLLAPPSVKGWDGNEAWINTTTLQNRVAFGDRLTRSQVLFRYMAPQVAELAQQRSLTPQAAWTDYLAEALGPLPLGTETRQTLIAYASEAPAAPPAGGVLTAATGGGGVAARRARRRALAQGGEATGSDGRMLSLIPLIMGTPEYQVC
jgi:uncharacterized protein (DUF1800 family)